jgi:L-aspartate oxidase
MPGARDRETKAHAGAVLLPDEPRLESGRLPEAVGRRYLAEFDTAELPQHDSDVLVIGSGIAGLMTALALGPERDVALVTKGRLSETGTWYAQGGIAGAIGEADSVELHLADTLVAGQGLCDEQVVRTVVGDAASALAELAAFGVRFDLAAEGVPSLAREGGHSLPRILHTGDATGASIQDALTGAVRKASHVHLAEEHFLVDLLTSEGRCVGALVLDRNSGEMTVHRASSVVLATGGCGQVYRVTTNPSIATGDGLAAAWRAGAEITDMEFVQFHPTALDSDEHPKTLITEALRGEGAYLLDCTGERFMLTAHPLAELAPRDVVVREIERVMVRCGQPHVWLDARHLGKEHLAARFPSIWERCLEAGYDLSADLVPVAPAAHYMIGGVRVDLDGRTSVPGLYAAGEVAASGLHGANRLASNSLLEGVVFSRRIARALREEAASRRFARIVSAPASGVVGPRIDILRAAVQDTMGSFAGMVRVEEGLCAAEAALAEMSEVLRTDAHRAEEFEVQNMVTVAALITHAARVRAETRGAHSRVDFPSRDDVHWAGHLLWRCGEAPRFAALPTTAVADVGGVGR